MTSTFWPHPNHFSQWVAGIAIAVLDPSQQQQVEPDQFLLNRVRVVDVLTT